MRPLVAAEKSVLAPRVVAIVPALDEEAAIGGVVERLRPLVAEVIVVDNDSRDRTAAVALAAGARVASEPRRGYGSACLAGAAAATAADVLVFVDGDGSDEIERLPDLVAPILAGQADLVVGSRTLGRRRPGGRPWHAVVGTRLCVWLMNALTGTRFTDLGPFRAIKTDALVHLGMTEYGFGWTVEMQVRAARHRLRTREIAVASRPRTAGQSKISGTLRGSLQAGARMLATIARYAVIRHV